MRTYSAWYLPSEMRHQSLLKIPTIDAGEISGIRNLRLRPISLEDTIYIDAGRESLSQYLILLFPSISLSIMSAIFKEHFTHLQLD